MVFNAIMVKCIKNINIYCLQTFYAIILVMEYFARIVLTLLTILVTIVLQHPVLEIFKRDFLSGAFMLEFK